MLIELRSKEERLCLFPSEEKEVIPLAHKKTTGKRAASAASKVLRDGRYSKTAKRAAGSALTQRQGKKNK
jgi:hypothetical protein